jgi:uncharacterized protein (DUF3084 family)
MTGLSGIVLIVALVIVSGVIAYVGDIVGRRMGRKRLSLFGMRPRHTAIAVSVVAGMSITIMTLAVAMGVSEDVKDGFLRVSAMRQQHNELSQRLVQLDRELKRREQEFDRRRKAADEQLRDTETDLSETRSSLDETTDRLVREQEKLADASSARRQAESALARAETAFARMSYEQRELWRQVQTLRAHVAGGIIDRATPVLFGAGQPLAAELIPGGASVAAIRSELDALVDGIDESARSAGARPLAGTEEAAVIRKPVREAESDTITWATGEEVLSAVAQSIHESTGGVIVRAYSVVNTYPGEPVVIDFELFRNRLVFHRGEQLAETVVDGRLPQPALMTVIVALLREEVGARARARNVMPRISSGVPALSASPRGSIGEMSYEELFAVIQRLNEINGPARVRAVAAADTWTMGPLDVDLLVAPADLSSPQ